jgi:signal transduction histidine kinase
MIGIVSLGFLLLSVFYLARVIARFFFEEDKTKMRKKWILIFMMGCILVVVLDFKGVVDMVLVLWAWVLLVLALLFKYPVRRKNVFTHVILGLVVITFYSAYMFEKYVSIKDRNNLEVLAGRILDGTDSDAEYRFLEFQKDLASDSLIWAKKDIQDYSEDELQEQLSRKYFKGFWTKYDITVSVFDSEGNQLSRPNESVARTEKQMDDAVYAWEGKGNLSGLTKTIESENNVNYILRMNVGDNIGRVFIELALRIIPEELGFPELLLEREDMFDEELSEYSIAQYKGTKLLAQHGDYDYKTERDFDKMEMGSDRAYFNENGFTHYPFRRSQETYVISGESKSSMGHVTTFTYLFTMFGFMMLIGVMIERLIVGRTTMVINLQNKIQMLIIGIVIASLFIFGFGAYYYIISQNQEKNENLLSEKVESVLIELSHKLEKEQAINDKDKLELYLDKFSKVFFTDINLFDLEGRLMASSRPQLFNKGVISTQMEPQAFIMLSRERESKYIHQENIGKLNYLSAYVPFRNSQNEILAYLNLPYFAKQSELENELSAFVVAVVNILVVLFALSTIIALIFSNWITRPLKILQENLASIRLDRTNRPIQYSGTDEIASLVKEYNAKVKELEENAEVLAKSERESAWREMAKQVAHEIKNPLTPMKLSIQYLQRSWEDGSEDWDSKFIEQIDTLSGIATAFSDFAQMPTPATEKFGLIGLLEQAVELFAGHPDMSVTFTSEVSRDELIVADKGQLTRLFNNLLKNAIQSIPDDQEGKVTVELMVKGFNYIIEVKDNGVGIPAEMTDKIFVPNFTTKTTGTGLGLAMCKNIVESAGGEIWFKSKMDVGTSFFVSLPKK